MSYFRSVEGYYSEKGTGHMTKPQLRLLVLVAALLIGPSSFLTADSSHAQAAANPEHDLWGSNIGDSILLKWLGEPGATQYIVYREYRSLVLGQTFLEIAILIGVE